jgi:hypothetical protein
MSIKNTRIRLELTASTGAVDPQDVSRASMELLPMAESEDD